MWISCNLPPNLHVPCLCRCPFLPLTFHPKTKCFHPLIYLTHIADIVSDNTFQFLTCLQFHLCTNACRLQQYNRHFTTVFGQPIAWQLLPRRSMLMMLSASRLLCSYFCNMISWPSIWLILHSCFPQTTVTCLVICSQMQRYWVLKINRSDCFLYIQCA